MAYLDSANQQLPYASGSETSRDAAIRAKRFVGKQGLTVLGWFAHFGATGSTQKEASDGLRIGRASIAARVNALEQCGDLVKTDLRRGGCAVYRTVEE